jgi:hypothetical protein
MMKKSFFAAGILSFALVSLGNAQGAVSSAEDSDHYTQAQLKQMAHDARTQDQYKVLASSYERQQKDYLQQAAEEKQEWERRSQNIVSINAKYPRPVDSAKYLYEYYAYKASEAGALSAKYSHLVEPSVELAKQ